MKPDEILQFNRGEKNYFVRKQFNPQKVDGLGHSAEGMILVAIWKIKYKSVLRILQYKAFGL